MSLEAALKANTEAIYALSAMLSGGQLLNAAAVAQAAPVAVAPPPVPVAPPAAPAAAPVGAALMPAPPFPGVAQPAGLPPRPFNDALGLLDWAKGKYGALYAANPAVVDKFTTILQQHGLDQVGIGAAQPTQFDSLYQAISALG